MKLAGMTMYAAVTGDIVRSTKIDSASRKAIPSLLSSAANSWTEAHPNSLINGLHVFRGDAWQVLIQKPRLALQFAIFIRASLKTYGLDTRTSIAIATMSFVPQGRFPEGDGEAFCLSGRGLDRLSREEHMCFSMPSLEREKTMQLVVQLTDTLVGAWTSRQALVMTRVLSGFTHNRIAESLSQSQQVVHHLLARAHVRDILSVLKYFEDSIKDAIGENSGDYV